MDRKHDLCGPDEEWVTIFRPWKHAKDGTILYAKNYGLKAWPIRIRRKRVDED